MGEATGPEAKRIRTQASDEESIKPAVGALVLPHQVSPQLFEVVGSRINRLTAADCEILEQFMDKAIHPSVVGKPSHKIKINEDFIMDDEQQEVKETLSVVLDFKTFGWEKKRKSKSKKSKAHKAADM